MESIGIFIRKLIVQKQVQRRSFCSVACALVATGLPVTCRQALHCCLSLSRVQTRPFGI